MGAAMGGGAPGSPWMSGAQPLGTPTCSHSSDPGRPPSLRQGEGRARCETSSVVLQAKTWTVGRKALWDTRPPQEAVSPTVGTSLRPTLPEMRADKSAEATAVLRRDPKAIARPTEEFRLQSRSGLSRPSQKSLEGSRLPLAFKQPAAAVLTASAAPWSTIGSRSDNPIAAFT